MLKKNTTDTLQNYLFLRYFVMETYLILNTLKMNKITEK